MQNADQMLNPNMHAQADKIFTAMIQMARIASVDWNVSS